MEKLILDAYMRVTDQYMVNLQAIKEKNCNSCGGSKLGDICQALRIVTRHGEVTCDNYDPTQE